MARSSGKVYFLDSDCSSTPDPIHTGAFRHRFSILRIYSATWNQTNNKTEYNFAGEAYDVPLSISASYTFEDGKITLDGKMKSDTSDHIYFKPDGMISSHAKDIRGCSETRPGLYYQIDFKSSGSTVLKSFKDE
jgi:hypothetical protein